MAHKLFSILSSVLAADKKKKEQQLVAQLVKVCNEGTRKLELNDFEYLAENTADFKALHPQTRKKLAKLAYKSFETAYTTEKERIMLETYRKMQENAIESDKKALKFIESADLPKRIRVKIQQNLEKIDYVKINASVKAE